MNGKELFDELFGTYRTDGADAIRRMARERPADFVAAMFWYVGLSDHERIMLPWGRE